jgi:hypothetical protein
VSRVKPAPLALLLASCAHAPAPAPTPPPAPATDPIAALEQRLLSSPTFRLHCRVSTGGRIVSRFEGTITAGEGQRLRMQFDGSFGNRDVTARLLSDGTKMEGGSSDKTFDFDTPPGLREGIVVSLVRMGITHQIAKLSTGEPPDFLDGHAQDRVQAVGPTREAGEPLHGAPTDRYGWLLYIDHERKGEEQVWFDASTGAPLQRRIVVHFPEGDMNVSEDYDELAVGELEAPATFAIPAAHAP